MCPPGYHHNGIMAARELAPLDLRTALNVSKTLNFVVTVSSIRNLAARPAIITRSIGKFDLKQQQQQQQLTTANYTTTNGDI